MKPVYPPAARREGREGVVLLRIRISESGAVDKIAVERSSGSPDLDTSATEAVRRWEFGPAIPRGEVIQLSLLVPIQFVLE